MEAACHKAKEEFSEIAASHVQIYKTQGQYEIDKDKDKIHLRLYSICNPDTPYDSEKSGKW